MPRKSLYLREDTLYNLTSYAQQFGLYRTINGEAVLNLSAAIDHMLQHRVEMENHKISQVQVYQIADADEELDLDDAELDEEQARIDEAYEYGDMLCDMRRGT